MAEFNCCIVIPHFNHADQLEKMLPALRPLALPVLVVDDGSSPDSLAKLRRVIADHSYIELMCLSSNAGKGAAVIAAAQQANRQGFTHILQIDADGQHNVASVPPMIDIARHSPRDLISGLPEFSSDIPAARLHGRKITLFWARLETLSREIKDAMCGFRVYPLQSLLAVYEGSFHGVRMEFDSEIMVRLHWMGVRVRFLPVQVQYPEGGASHFHFIRDNIRISVSHAKLTMGMLLRLPYLLVRNISRVDR